MQINQKRKIKVLILAGLLKRTYYNVKLTEIEGKITSISGLAKNTALIAVENKIPNISSLVKKADYDTRITEIEKKTMTNLLNHHDKPS